MQAAHFSHKKTNYRRVANGEIRPEKMANVCYTAVVEPGGCDWLINAQLPEEKICSNTIVLEFIHTRMNGFVPSFGPIYPIPIKSCGLGGCFRCPRGFLQYGWHYVGSFAVETQNQRMRYCVLCL